MATRVGLVEALGVLPLATTARQVRLALGGDASTPRTRFGLSSLRQLQPRFAVPLWLGRKPVGRRVPLTNLFNYRQPPPELGWSVRVTDVEDFRGGQNSYDSHNGTDLAIPPGTDVLTAAAGMVVRVSSEYHRGGRKVLVDHGGGLVTGYAHLARPLVEPGQRVARGERIAISGYSGIDALVGFPWTPPHVHFNVWLGGRYVDPFGRPGEVSLWRAGNEPAPAPPGPPGADDCSPTAWDEAGVEAALAACRHAESRDDLAGRPTLAERAGTALFLLNYFPTRFAPGVDAAVLYGGKAFARAPRLDLPFSHRDYDGVMFPDR
jgi:murein DD-endopeptidase MepM/ murein hydrolase activator NlpD